jgi:hypothetical protein
MATDFKDRIEDPHAWFIFAEISLRAAGVLWKVSDTGRSLGPAFLAGRLTEEESAHLGSALQMSIPSLLLAGFGLESLMKAIRLRQMFYRGEPMTAAKKGKVFLVGTLKTHDLKHLAQQVGVPLDASEEHLLDRLTTFVMWAGRYPVSIGEEGLVPNAGEYTAADGSAVSAFARKLFEFSESSPQLVGTTPNSERVESVKIEPNKWRVTMVSDGTVTREAYGDSSLAVYTVALGWLREPRRPKTA